MKIFYKQPEDGGNGSLVRYGVQSCYFKSLAVETDRYSITKKAHLHTGFEMHMITEGRQRYAVNGEKHTLNKGDFLLIYPNVPHTVLSSDTGTKKFSITFKRPAAEPKNCFYGKASDRMLKNALFISGEALKNKDISSVLIENSILEILVHIFRLSGEKERDCAVKTDQNATLEVARQYIRDNVEAAPSVAELSRYCCLSTKQLTRIFITFEGITPGEYIRNCRISKIEALLSDTSLSLRQISEIMSFENEYYFSSFFKKYNGLPPGKYRKMHNSQN